MTTAGMSICQRLLFFICLLAICKASTLSRNEKATEAASDSNELPSTTSVSGARNNGIMESTDFTQRESTDSDETVFDGNNIQTTDDQSGSILSHMETPTPSNDEIGITSTETQNPTESTAIKLKKKDDDGLNDLDMHNEESINALDEYEVDERFNDKEVGRGDVAEKYNKMNASDGYWNRTMILTALVIGFASLLFSCGVFACVWRCCCNSHLEKHLVLADAEEEIEDISVVAPAHLNIKDSTLAVFDDDNIIII